MGARAVVAAFVVGLLVGCGGTRTAVVAPFDPVSFTAISPTDFWLLGASSCAHPVCASILHTTDDGRHFAKIGAPPAVLSLGGDSSGAIDTLRFATDNDGFAFDEQSFSRGDGTSDPIWQTTDGGVHWHRAGLRHVLAFATGGGFAYVVTGACRAGRCHELAMRRTARRPGGHVAFVP